MDILFKICAQNFKNKRNKLKKEIMIEILVLSITSLFKNSSTA